MTVDIATTMSSDITRGGQHHEDMKKNNNNNKNDFGHYFNRVTRFY